MALLELLVQKLPESRGWPKEAVYCIYHEHKGGVTFYGAEGEMVKNGVGFIYLCIPNVSREEVTREQYEAALAASKTEWDGEGLPPVGSKVSFFYNERYDYNEEIIPQNGQELEVVAHKRTTDEHDVAVCYWDENGGGMAVCLVPGSLLPTHSEADKKRAECVIALSRIDPQAMPFEYGDKHSDGSLIGPFWYELYDAIAAGKIPHIRID
ncbi:hypothetical protein WP8W19C02_10240 [Enterobacter cloacae]|nr:hypothetical protein WP8W19C02_10240 [Enterobacter cloacae]